MKHLQFKLEKKELLYAFTGICVILAWFLYLKEMISVYLVDLFPFFAMLLYNSGTFFGLVLISNTLNSTKTRMKASLIGFMILLGEDVIMAPYLIGSTGITNKSIELWNVSSDVGFASIYQLFLNGSVIWYLTYIVTPILLIFVLPIIISNTKAIRKIFT